MFVVQIDFASPEYDELVQLRINQLLKPLGLELEEADFIKEANDFHFALYSADLQLFGGLFLRLDDAVDEAANTRAWIHQVVINNEHRLQGLGALLLHLVEQKAQELGIEKLLLRSHEAAIPFYESLGYVAEGESSVHAGIIHQLLQKRLFFATKEGVIQ